MKSNHLQRLAWGLFAAALLVGVLTRFVSLLKYTTVDIGAAPDQIRDAFVYMQMRAGEFPLLGPSSSVGGYSLPPLYFFLTYPAVLLGVNPTWQVLPNAIVSFLSIPLFGLLIYRLLFQVPSSRRSLIAGLASFWYCLIFGFVFISNFEWNPVPIPCFLFAFLLLYDYQLNLPKSSISVKESVTEIGSWGAYGVCLAILVSCHSTTLFVMPVVYLGSLVYFVVRRRRWLGPLISLGFVVVALFPYWYGELFRGWANSKRILGVIRGSGDDTESLGVWARIGRMFLNYTELSWQVYVVNMGEDIPWLRLVFALILVGAIAFAAIHSHRVNPTLWWQLVAVWGLYLLAASNFTDDYLFHYKLMFFFAPIVLMAIILAYPPKRLFLRTGVFVSVLTFIVLSCASNLSLNVTFMASKFGHNSVMSMEDMLDLAQTLPSGSTICDARYVRKREKHHVIKYINQFMLDQSLQLTPHCHRGDYLISPKRVYLFKNTQNQWPTLTTASNQFFDQVPAKLIQETATARIYQLKENFEPDKCDSFVGDFYTSTPCKNLDYPWPAQAPNV